MDSPKDIVITVTDTRGQKLSLEVSWETTYDEMSVVFRTILTFLEFAVEEGEYERHD